MLFFVVVGMEAWKAGYALYPKEGWGSVELTTRFVSGSLHSALYTKQSKQTLWFIWHNGVWNSPFEWWVVHFSHINHNARVGHDTIVRSWPESRDYNQVSQKPLKIKCICRSEGSLLIPLISDAGMLPTLLVTKMKVKGTRLEARETELNQEKMFVFVSR